MRRGRNDGTIFQRKKNGKVVDGWIAEISLGPGAGRETFYAKRRGEAQEWLTAKLREKQLGLSRTGKRMTTGQALTQWLEQVAKPRVRPATYTRYSGLVKKHIIPSIGAVQLEKLTPRHVQTMLNAKAAAGMAPRGVHHVRAVLRTALNQAVRWGDVPRNVAALTDSPRVEAHEFTVLDPEQAGQLLAAASGDRLEALYAVAIALGLRQGEALGLRWQDVDLDARQLHVRHALQRIDGRLQLVEPKTKRSRRTITMPAAVVTPLREHRRRQLDEQRPVLHLDGFVFAHPDGSPLDGTVVTHQFQKLLKRAGLPRLRFHDLRHSCASLLFAQHVSARMVMETLGHSNISTTMDIYAHMLPSLRQEAADAMDRTLDGTGR
jgi:integrase